MRENLRMEHLQLGVFLNETVKMKLLAPSRAR
jgi:hypothetical protein